MDEYSTTPLTEVIPASKKQLLRNLNGNGFHTLEDCARLGTRKLMQTKGVGFFTLTDLRRACHSKKIQWIKDVAEITQLDDRADSLVKVYGMSKWEALKICEVLFILNW